MSWFSFTDIAKNALSEAQKKIDKALDIQGKDGDVSGGKETFSQLEPSDLKPPKPEVKAIKKVELGSKVKQKATVTTQRTLNLSKKSFDINEDFFAVLNDENVTLSPRKADVSNIKKVKLVTELKEEKPEIAKVADASFDTNSSESSTKTLQESEFTEVPLIPSEEIPSECFTSDVSAELSPSLLGDNVTSAVDMKCDAGHISDMHSNSTLLRENDLEDYVIAADGNSLSDCTDACKETLFRMPPDHSEERAVSPNGSTAASSEIEILDHESTVSDASRCNEVQNLIQSPLQLQNIDSDASQTQSPVPESMNEPKRSSPDLATSENVKQLEDTIPTLSFQPVCQVDSVSIHIQDSSQDLTASQLSPNERGEAKAPESIVSKSDTSTKSCKVNFAKNDAKGLDEKYLAMSEKMEVYEQQLINLSKKNAQLNEENDNLRSEISRTREECLNESHRELASISDSVKSYEASNKVLHEEKMNLIKQMGVLKSQLASRMTNEQVQNAIGEKEESIKGLMEEGEVLAKKHLQQNNLIKKLKSQAQDREAELKAFREKVTNYEAENTRLKEDLKIAHGQGKEEREASLRISDAYEQRDRETQILQEKLSQSEEKQRTLQVNLDTAYKEIGDLHKQIAEQESRTSAEWEEKESEILRENEIEKKKIASEHDHQKQLLMLQIMELNNSVARLEAASGRKDDDHRKEIKELQQRLQESDGRNQDLSDNVSSATRPLLRQIENLQATHASQQRSWNALEKTLNSRVEDSQSEMLAARESERIAQNVAFEARSKAAAFEKRFESSKNTMSEQENEIGSLGKQLDEYKSQAKLLTEELEELKRTQKELVHKSRKDRLFLENQLQLEKVRSEAERKKYTAQQESFQKEKDRLMWSRSEMTSVSSNQVLETESIGSSNDAFHASDTLEKQFSSSSLSGLTSQLSYEGGKAMSMSNILENLQSQLKLKDGEIAQLRGEINMLERTRSSMAEEIVRLTNLNEDLEGVAKELEDMKGRLADVESRYAAILTMYGEKEEENDELKMDLVDVKALYRQQINELLRGDSS